MCWRCCSRSGSAAGSRRAHWRATRCAVTVAFTALSGQRSAWPWALAILPAVLGGAAGLAPLASLVSVQPLDETGNPTPAWSLKVHIALLAVALTGLPPVLVLLAGGPGHLPWLRWAAVPAGLATGACLAGWLGQRAVTRLEHRQVPILRLLADAAR
jgi:ABC-2 type transport system permease protein